MTETLQKYELLALLPLTGTEAELHACATKIEERIKAAGGAIAANRALHKGRLAYSVGKAHQGSYHLIQFEMDPAALRQFRRDLLLTGEISRFTITQAQGAFKAFVPSPPHLRERPARAIRTAAPMASRVMVAPPLAAVPTPLAQEAVKPDEAPKVTMEELDKRLEEILGE